MYRSILIILTGIVIILAIAIPTSSTYACSGGPPPWEEWLPRLIDDSDVIVVGNYDKLDDTETNGIFRVTSYLDGEGSEYLLIRSDDIRRVENERNVDRRYPPCLMNTRVNTSSSYLYFLSRQNDGTYTIKHSRNYQSAHNTAWEVPEGTKLAEAVSEITLAVGHEPQLPDTKTAYPRTTPILITTTEGQHFLLPVDTTEAVPVAESELVDLRRDQHECSGPPCTVYSPNGLDKVRLISTEQDPPEEDRSLNYIAYSAVGERIAFSSTSDTYVLWHEDQMKLYALWYPRIGYPDDRFSDFIPSPEFITAIPAGSSIDYPIAWRPDGRMLAFSTDEGLWLWDALTIDYPPQLLVPTTSDVPVARYFSPQGRYLAITDGDRHYNYDLVTQRELPDGYVSPDDRTLLVFDTAAEDPTTLEVAYLAPGIRQSEFYPEVQYLDVAWIDDVYFYASITGFSFLRYKPVAYESASGEITYEAVPYVVEEPFTDVVTYHSSGLHWIESEVPYAIDEIQMQDFIYEAGAGLIKVSADGYHLRIGRDLLSFKTSLPAPIAEVVWLPSVFYYVQD